MNICPLCSDNNSQHYAQDKKRKYWQCNQCSLVYVPEKYQLSQNDEKAEYDKHQNSPQDEGYRQFLNRTVKPLLKQLKPNAQGLDFGCGAGPTISEMLKPYQIAVENYDLYYFNQPELLEKQYQFITLTEVIEHIAMPAKLLKLLDSMLLAQGILAIMTKRVSNLEAFKTWHYKNDPTHICFYSQATFQWIAQKMHWRLEVQDKDVVFFHKD